MNEQEATEILQTIEAMYPSFTRGDKRVLKLKIQLWKEELLKWDYDLTKKNLMQHLRTEKFVPTLAEIKPTTYEFDSIHKKISEVFEDDAHD